MDAFNAEELAEKVALAMELSKKKAKKKKMKDQQKVVGTTARTLRKRPKLLLVSGSEKRFGQNPNARAGYLEAPMSC